MMKLRTNALLLAAAAGTLTLSAPAHAGLEPFVGQLMPTANNFCPRGSIEASGQLIAIAQNTALFSLLGTTYGGDGRSTFALPNLNGRAPIGRGQAPGLPLYDLGQTSGTNEIQLSAANLPAHTHSGTLKSVAAVGNSTQPTRNSLAQAPSGSNIYSTSAPANNMNAGDVNILSTGGGQPFTNQSPYVAMRYCIATQGVFPPRP